MHNCFTSITLLLYFIFSPLSILASDTIPTSLKPKKGVIREIKIVGNKITKDHIVLRELSFSIGDTLNSEEILKRAERSRSNLLNTSLFNFVTVEPVFIDSTHINIYI